MENKTPKHLRYFESEAEFEAKKESIDQPWVVYVEDSKKSHFQDIEIPYLKITVADTTDTAHLVLTCEKNASTKGEIRWSHNLSPEMCTIEGTNLVFNYHYDGEITLTATADNVSDSKTIYVFCGEEVISTTYELYGIDASSPVSASTTSAEIHYQDRPLYEYTLGRKEYGEPLNMTKVVSFPPNTTTSMNEQTGSFTDERGVTVNWTVWQNGKTIEPLKFTAVNGHASIGMNYGSYMVGLVTLSKSSDGQSWSQWDYTSDTLELNEGESVYVKGNVSAYEGLYGMSFDINHGDVAASGNIMSLVNNETQITKNNCFKGLFQDCKNLVSAPELPATTLKNCCYTEMFSGCTKLTSAPELPATTLASSCYCGMFYGCTSLTSAPELPATTLKNYCYSYMFDNCNNLNYIKVGATSWDEYNSYEWLRYVAPYGIFVKPSGTSINRGWNGIPDYWDVHNI